jgi:hypothetical protein
MVSWLRDMFIEDIMKEFPDCLQAENTESFGRYRYERTLCCLRGDIYEHMLRGDENNYFDMENFARSAEISSEETNSLLKTIMTELVKRGFKCKLCFGSTGLFIYSTPDPPASYYPDGL